MNDEEDSAQRRRDRRGRAHRARHDDRPRLGPGGLAGDREDRASASATPPPIRAAFASNRTAELARAAGIAAATLDGRTRLDLALDGADEIDPQLGLLKGGGGALLREKIVIASADRFVVVAEARKRVSRLGETFRLPVEVVRFGWPETRKRVLEILPTAELRRRDRDEPYITDEGHLLLDCELPASDDLERPGRAHQGRPSASSSTACSSAWPTRRCSAAPTGACDVRS